MTDVLVLPEQNFKQGASEHDMGIVTGLSLGYTLFIYFFFLLALKVICPLSSEVRNFKQGASEYDMGIVTVLCLVYTPFFFLFPLKVLSSLSSEVIKGL